MPWAPTPCATRLQGAGGEAFGLAGPAQGLEEALKRLRGTKVLQKQILPELNLGSGQTGQPSCGSLQEFLQSTH